MSLRDQIKATDDHRSETVECPEWGVSVVVRSISAGERNAMLKNVKDNNDPMAVGIQFQGEIILKTCHDADGNKVFEPADLEWLMDKNAEVLDRLTQAGFRVSGMEKDAVDLGKGGSS